MFHLKFPPHALMKLSWKTDCIKVYPRFAPRSECFNPKNFASTWLWDNRETENGALIVRHLTMGVNLSIHFFGYGSFFWIVFRKNSGG